MCGRSARCRGCAPHTSFLYGLFDNINVHYILSQVAQLENDITLATNLVLFVDNEVSEKDASRRSAGDDRVPDPVATDFALAFEDDEKSENGALQAGVEYYRVATNFALLLGGSNDLSCEDSAEEGGF